MEIFLFTLNKEHKRRLIELMLVIFSLIIVISKDKAFDTTYALGVMPSTFLFMSILYWIALDKEKIFSSYEFKLVAFIISLTFSVMLSRELLLFFPETGIISEILFWAYYIMFTFIIFIALISNEDDLNKDKGHLKPLWKLILIISFILILILLAKLF